MGIAHLQDCVILSVQAYNIPVYENVICMQRQWQKNKQDFNNMSSLITKVYTKCT